MWRYSKSFGVGERQLTAEAPGAGCLHGNLHKCLMCIYMQNFSLAETKGEKNNPTLKWQLSYTEVHTNTDLCSDSVNLPPSQSNACALNFCLTFAQDSLKTHSRPPSLPRTDVNILQMWPSWLSRQRLPVKRASENAAFPFNTNLAVQLS